MSAANNSNEQTKLFSLDIDKCIEKLEKCEFLDEKTTLELIEKVS